jgi:two-component system cell cycle response regulator DivK
MKSNRRRKFAPKQTPQDRAATPLILIVEDNDDTRQLWIDYLAFRGFRVVGVPNGVAAVDEALDILPDIIVMDLALPQLDGWEATRRIKRHPRTAHIPIVACTADAFPASAERALVAGCDGYVVKPCLPDDLVAVLRNMLGESPGRQRRRA